MFKSILIFQRPGIPTDVGKWVLDAVVQWAINSEIDIRYHKENEPSLVDDDTLFVSIGGDGTMLRAMDVSLKTNITHFSNTAVVGFNAGTLGFLSEDPAITHPAQMLDAIREESDGVVLNEYMALATTIDDDTHYAINEFTFTPGSIADFLQYDIMINNKFVAEHKGSGCLVSTSTGSTAMAMSAGGAIIHPSTNIMQIVPIIPHTLVSRPIITTGKDTVNLTSMVDNVDKVVVSSDGRVIKEFTDGANLRIEKAQVSSKVWHVKKRDFFNVLSNKLKW